MSNKIYGRKTVLSFPTFDNREYGSRSKLLCEVNIENL